MKTESFYDRAETFFAMAQKTPTARRVLDLIRWNQNIPFFVDDKPAFYLVVQRGSVKVFPGKSPELEPEERYHNESRVYTDAETLDRLLDGKKDPIEAQWEDEAIRLLPTGNYAQNTLILQLFQAGRQEILSRRVREFEGR